MGARWNIYFWSQRILGCRQFKFQKKKNLVKEFFIKEQSIVLFALFLSGFLGAYLVDKKGLNIIWIFGALSYFITGLMLLFIKEQKITKEKSKKFSDLFLVTFNLFDHLTDCLGKFTVRK